MHYSYNNENVFEVFEDEEIEGHNSFVMNVKHWDIFHINWL